MGEFAATTDSDTPKTSCYRVKFLHDEFLQMVSIARPRIIYHVNRIYFFSYDGFVMYSFECQRSDFEQGVMEAIEFSNEPWAET